jgi:hypothetical protein
MAADLSIHVLTDEFTEEHCKAFASHTLGSKHFNLGYDRRFEKEHGCDLFSLAADTPSVWVGEVSWLKAALSGEDEEFIPDAVGSISEIIGEDFPVIDDSLIQRIDDAMKLPNTTEYSINSAGEVLAWLKAHKGERAFTVSW